MQKDSKNEDIDLDKLAKQLPSPKKVSELIEIYEEKPSSKPEPKPPKSNAEESEEQLQNILAGKINAFKVCSNSNSESWMQVNTQQYSITQSVKYKKGPNDIELISVN